MTFRKWFLILLCIALLQQMNWWHFFTEHIFQEKKKVAPTGTIVIPVNVHIVRKSFWTRAEAEKRIDAASNYFEKHCDMTLDIKSVSFGSEPGLYELESYNSSYKYAYLNPEPKKAVLIIFTGKDLSLPYKTGYAWIPASVEGHPELTNSIFIFEKLLTYTNKEYPQYDVIAHEFGHVLLGEGHNSISRNFMSGNYNGMDITKEQCEKIRLNGSALSQI